MNQASFSAPCLGYELCAYISVLDHGLDVLLVGGCKQHVGSVSVAAAGQADTIQLPGHKDGVIGELWAKKLADHFCVPVSVTCGIHYDNATKEQIHAILQTAQELLSTLIANIIL